jgi:uncharacterized phiE125 gp8 family phage protein
MTTGDRKAIRSASPTFEPVTLAEAKKHLELADDDNAHDAHVLRLIVAAREQVEHDCGVVLATGTFTLTLDDFPGDTEIYLPVRPVSSITSIVYTLENGSTGTMSASEYLLDNNEAEPEITLAYLADWPTARGEPNSVTITFVAGYATPQAIPQSFKQMLLVDIARRFQDREGLEKIDESQAYERMIRRYQRVSYP